MTSSRPRQEPKKPDPPGSPWVLPEDGVAEALSVDTEEGLSSSEVERRQRRHGRNTLREMRPKSAWRILWEQLRSLIMALLAVAAAISFSFGEMLDGAAILAVIVINTAIGFFTELKAVRSMEALRKLGRVSAKVRREGRVQDVPAAKLVPGDVVVLEGGDIVSADIRLTSASRLQADESALTGESVPVEKQTEPVEENAVLADRSSMVYKGTSITRGSGEGIVIATGMRTELGAISALVEEAEEERTPLEKRLEVLAQKLVWLTLAVAAVVAVAGIAGGQDLLIMIETAVALAVAAIPEGLPIVATIALARGMWRMARQNALINNLSAVETLGATTIIFTDKTGTLTENRMTVTRLAVEDGTVEVGEEGPNESAFTAEGQELDLEQGGVHREMLEVAVLCNNASLEDSEDGENGSRGVGDPMEVALLAAGRKAGITRPSLLEQQPEEREEAFDSEVRMMATFHRSNGELRVAVKGAPEAVLEASERSRDSGEGSRLEPGDRDRWLELSRDMAAEGARLLALATRTTGDVQDDPYSGLTFLGLVALWDPPRKEVAAAIEACRSAGIRVIVVTGDHAATALGVAQAVGIVDDGHGGSAMEGRDLAAPEELSESERRKVLETGVFARVSPRQKLDLIALHQERDEIVAMTGDGVNDAPALKKAEIGIAMGRRGTQVAREAADMVLTDDSFATISSAVEQGRVIFGNIRKFVLFLLSCNLSEILIVSLGSLTPLPLLLRPLQILFLNLATDVFPALALGAGRGDGTRMQDPPRDPEEGVITRAHWLAVGGYSAVMSGAVLGAFLTAGPLLEWEPERALTISFLTLAFAQLWHVFNLRERGSGLLRNDVTRNPFVWGALALCTGILVAAVHVPALARVLHVEEPGLDGWLLIAGFSLLPLLICQGFAWLRGEERREAGGRPGG